MRFLELLKLQKETYRFTVQSLPQSWEIDHYKYIWVIANLRAGESACVYVIVFVCVCVSVCVCVLAPLQKATRALRKQEIAFESKKTLEFVKTQKIVKTEKFYNLGPKICPPPDFWESKNRSTRVYGTRVGLPHG